VGGAKAVEALLDSLDTSDFIPERRFEKRNYDREVSEHHKFVFAALARLIKNAPLASDAPPTDQNQKRWKDWWAQNKSTAVLTNLKQ
jgi:hypothetical protein